MEETAIFGGSATSAIFNAETAMQEASDVCSGSVCQTLGASKKYNLSINTRPEISDLRLTLSDKDEVVGKTPFKGMVPEGTAKAVLSRFGYNTLETEISVKKDTEALFNLDRSGQLVHHLLDISGVPSPKAVAFSKDGEEVWSTMLLNKKRGLGVYNSKTGTNLANIDLQGGGGVELVFSNNGTKVYVSQMETALVYEIDAESKKILRTFDTKSAWTKVVILSPDGRFLFAANWSGNDVSMIDLESGAVTRIATVKTPRGLYAARDGKTLYVAGFGAGELQKIDLALKIGEVIYKTGGAMRHIAADEDKELLYISDMAKNAVYRYDLKSGAFEKFADTDFDPNTIVLSPDNKILFVSCRGRNAANDNYYIPGPEWGSVLLFDTVTGKMLDAIVGGNQPTALDVSKDGSTLAFSDFLDQKIELYAVPAYDVLLAGGGGRSGVYRQDLWKK